jgi:hypothetical protein
MRTKNSEGQGRRAHSVRYTLGVPISCVSIHIDPRLFKFVGIDPPLSLEEEKREIQRGIAARVEAK